MKTDQVSSYSKTIPDELAGSLPRTTRISGIGIAMAVTALVLVVVPLAVALFVGITAWQTDTGFACVVLLFSLPIAFLGAWMRTGSAPQGADPKLRNLGVLLFIKPPVQGLPVGGFSETWFRTGCRAARYRCSSESKTQESDRDETGRLKVWEIQGIAQIPVARDRGYRREFLPTSANAIRETRLTLGRLLWLAVTAPSPQRSQRELQLRDAASRRRMRQSGARSTKLSSVFEEASPRGTLSGGHLRETLSQQSATTTVRKGR